MVLGENHLDHICSPKYTELPCDWLLRYLCWTGVSNKVQPATSRWNQPVPWGITPTDLLESAWSSYVDVFAASSRLCVVVKSCKVSCRRSFVKSKHPNIPCCLWMRFYGSYYNATQEKACQVTTQLQHSLIKNLAVKSNLLLHSPTTASPWKPLHTNQIQAN